MAACLALSVLLSIVLASDGAALRIRRGRVFRLSRASRALWHVLCDPLVHGLPATLCDFKGGLIFDGERLETYREEERRRRRIRRRKASVPRVHANTPCPL